MARKITQLAGSDAATGRDSEEGRREAESLQEVDARVADISKLRQDAAVAFARLVGAPHRKQTREELVWRGLARYVNADLTNDADAFAVLARLLERCAPRQVLAPPELGDFGEIYEKHKRAGQPVSEVFIEKAVEHQPKLRRLLTWLCAPQEHPELRSEAIQFLQTSLHHIEWEIWEEPSTNLSDETSDDYFPVFYEQSVEYRSIMDPICKFIFDQVERFHNQDLNLSKAVPIRMCQRAACGKFFLPERTGRKQYCSNLCCSLDHERPTEQQRDYMWLYRLEKFAENCFSRKHGFKVADFRRKLESPKVKRRLCKIAERYKKDWPAIVERVKAIKNREDGGKEKREDRRDVESTKRKP